MTYDDVDTFTRGYIDCALWSSTDESTPQGGEPFDRNYTADDLAPEALAAVVDHCARFQAEQAIDLQDAGDAGRNGHDFWLTRNGHGAGFWDRGYGDVGDRLTAAAHAYGESDLYLGDDGRIYVS